MPENTAYVFESEEQVIDAALRIMQARIVFTKGSINQPRDSARLFQLRLSGQKREVFSCAFLDSQHGVIEIEDIFLGTVDEASVYPREIVRRVIELNSVAVVFAHNHPSGNTEPSQADITITKRLKEALNFIDVRVLDHIVVSPTGYTSLAEKGHL